MNLPELQAQIREKEKQIQALQKSLNWDRKHEKLLIQQAEEEKENTSSVSDMLDIAKGLK